ncbi:MAG: HEAT repeat domain-containing protein, partial [Anaerolineae bacterium]|nr:HEAT repeat domain-containing protein [Anaerolineae bacterium]
QGHHLHFYRWHFGEMPTFPELIARLKEVGCTDIQYSFTQYDLENPPFALHDRSDIEALMDVAAISDFGDDKEQAINLLGDFKDVRAVEVIVGALSSQDTWVQGAASRALGNIGDDRAVTPLINLLKNSNDYWLKETIIRALSRYQVPDAIQTIADTLIDDALWETSACTLGLIGSSARPIEVQFSKSDNEILRNRAKIADGFIQETIDGGSTLAALRGETEENSRAAFEQVQQRSDNGSVLLAYLKNPGRSIDGALQNDVIDFLIQANDLRVVDVLANRVLELGGKAINSLKAIGTPAVVTLIQLHRTHSETWVRESAFFALAELGDPRAYDNMVAWLENNPRQRDVAIRGLVKIGDRRAIELLMREFLHKDAEAVWYPNVTTFQLLQQLGVTSELVEPLLKRLEEESALVHPYIAEILGQIGDQRAVQPLQAALVTAEGKAKSTIEAIIEKLLEAPKTE